MAHCPFVTRLASDRPRAPATSPAVRLKNRTPSAVAQHLPQPNRPNYRFRASETEHAPWGGPGGGGGGGGGARGAGGAPRRRAAA